MTTAPPLALATGLGGPVSAALEADLRPFALADFAAESIERRNDVF